MGVTNRERRKAKQRERRQRMRARGAGDPRAEQRPPTTTSSAAGAAELLADAVHATNCPDHSDRERQEYRDALEAQPRRLVDRQVMTSLQQAVTRAWAHGWQPADLVRVAGRRRGAEAARMTVDAIAAEMRGYAAATVDDRWAAQLSQLGALVWWERDDAYLEARTAKHGLPRSSLIGCAIGVLAMLSQLPVLARLYPLPGTARSRPVDHPEMPVDQRVLDRVRALLAKAESTSFPEEAEAYTAKAQELMARYSIDQALLVAGAGAPSRLEPAGVRLGVDNPYEQPKALLLDCVAQANRCRAIWHKELGFSSVVGFPTDLEAVELLYTSLLVQATAAMLHEGSRRDRVGRSRTRSFRQSFLTAYASRIGERLRTATDDATQQAASETGRGDLLPVLAARERRVDETVDDLFPGVTSHSVRATNPEGWASGTAAADRASLTIREQVGGGHS
jgi:hypothetical protein